MTTRRKIQIQKTFACGDKVVAELRGIKKDVWCLTVTTEKDDVDDIFLSHASLPEAQKLLKEMQQAKEN